MEDNVKPEENITDALVVENKKSTQRMIFEVMHKLFGYFFLAFAAWEIHEGIWLYGLKYNVKIDHLQNAFIGWIAGLVGIVAIAKAYLVMLVPKNKKWCQY